MSHRLSENTVTTTGGSNDKRVMSNNTSQVPSHCRAIYFGGLSEPVYERIIETPTKIKNNHVFVKVHVVGLNPVDAKKVIGDKLPHHYKSIRNWMHNRLVKDTRVGFDFAGTVVDSCENQSCMYTHGTFVYGAMPPLNGSCAEYIQVPLHQIAKAKPSWSMEEAAAMPLVGLTCWQALHQHIVPNTSRVLVIGGSGGTGHIALQIAKALDANNVVSICSTKNIQFCKDCGATAVVDYTTFTRSDDNNNDEDDGLYQALKSLGPFDVIFDCVTSADPNDAKHMYPQRIRKEGLVTSNHLYQRLGGACSDWIRAGLARKLAPSFVWKDPKEQLFWIRFPHSSLELEQLAQLNIAPNVQKVYPTMTAATVQQALDDIMSRHVQGKVVVRVIPKEKNNK